MSNALRDRDEPFQEPDIGPNRQEELSSATALQQRLHLTTRMSKAAVSEGSLTGKALLGRPRRGPTTSAADQTLTASTSRRQNSGANLRIFNWNAWGPSTVRDELLLYLEEPQVDIAVLTETHWKQDGGFQTAQ